MTTDSPPHVRRIRLIWLFWLSWLAATNLVAQPTHPPAKVPQVLILNSYHPGYNWSDGEQIAVLHTLIQARPNLLPRIEYLDWRRFPQEARLSLFLGQLEQKYGRHAFDLVIALDDPAVEFVLKHREFFGADVPVVFGGVNDSNADYFQRFPRVTGVMQTYDFGGTLALIRQLQPGVNKITAVHCQTESGLATRRALERFLAQNPQPFTFDWCEGWTADELLIRLSALPRDHAVLLLSIFSDRHGRVLTDDESFGRTLAARSAVPVYFLAPPMVKHFGGNAWDNATWQGLGGSIMDSDLHGELVGQLALRVLNGEPLDQIPIVRESPSRIAVDYPQMMRFGLPLDALPSEAAVFHSPASFYQINRARILAGLITIAVLGVTVVVLLAFIWQRRRGERALRRSHAHFQLIARATNDAVWDWDLGTNAMWWNDGYIQQLQLPPATPPNFATWATHLHPEDRTSVVQTLQDAIHAGSEHSAIEYRVLRQDGSIRFVYDRIFVERQSGGSPLRLLGARLDLTDRKLAEQELRRLAAAIEQSAEAILLINPDGAITYTNPAFSRITGHPAPTHLKQLYAALQDPPHSAAGLWNDPRSRAANRPLDHPHRRRETRRHLLPLAGQHHADSHAVRPDRQLRARRPGYHPRGQAGGSGAARAEDGSRRAARRRHRPRFQQSPPPRHQLCLSGPDGRHRPGARRLPPANPRHDRSSRPAHPPAPHLQSQRAHAVGPGRPQPPPPSPTPSPRPPSRGADPG